MTSCYASYPHDLVHSFMGPARIFPFLLQEPSIIKGIRSFIGESSGVEGNGEAMYVSIVKIIGKRFYSSDRILPQVYQVASNLNQDWYQKFVFNSWSLPFYEFSLSLHRIW